MAYGLRFYSRHIRDGRTYEMQILRRDYDGIQMRIGSMQALSVGYDGNGDIVAPVLKSQLRFTVCDAYDIPVTNDGDGIPVKYGSWEELYTSDATLYKVLFLEDGNVRWSGYLTPDSYEEDLIYHGSVSFIARDMLGHASEVDFTFDAESGKAEHRQRMCSIRDLIGRGLELCGCAMDIDYTYAAGKMRGGTEEITEDSYTDVLDMLVNVEQFYGRTWGDVLEDVLGAVGLCLRWVDDNRIAVGFMRYLPDIMSGMKEIRWANRSGHRAMIPAVRKIMEVDDYQSSADLIDGKVRSDDFIPTSLTIFGHTVNSYEPSAQSGWRRTGNIGICSQFARPDGVYSTLLGGTTPSYQYHDNYLFVSILDARQTPTYNDNSPRITRRIPCMLSGENVRFSFDVLADAFISSGSSLAKLYSLGNPPRYIQTTIGWSLHVKGKYDGQTYDWYWDDHTRHALVGNNGIYINRAVATWDVDNQKYINASILCEFSMPQEVEYVELAVYGASYEEYIINTVTQGHIDAPTPTLVANGLGYAVLANLSFGLMDETDYDRFVTTTVYNEKNNVLIETSPAIVQSPYVASPKVVKNGIYYYVSGTDRYPSVDSFRWSDEASGNRLSLLTAKQLLMFHCEPSNELTGEILDATANDPRFDAVYVWNGTKHLLSRGSLNVLTGRMEDVTLRQFKHYDDLWGNRRDFSSDFSEDFK